jgi:hypothetical protein
MDIKSSFSKYLQSASEMNLLWWEAKDRRKIQPKDQKKKAAQTLAMPAAKQSQDSDLCKRFPKCRKRRSRQQAGAFWQYGSKGKRINRNEVLVCGRRRDKERRQGRGREIARGRRRGREKATSVGVQKCRCL